TPKVLICPEDSDSKLTIADTFDRASLSTYSKAISFTNDNNLSYFAGVDAENESTHRLLSGDRNLNADRRPARHGLCSISTNSLIEWRRPQHGGCGNLGLSDGSVNMSSGKLVRIIFQNTGLATNRIALP